MGDEPSGAASVAAIERATLAGVAPAAIEALDGWLLPMDHGGFIGRARSAVPLAHEAGEGHGAAATVFDPGVVERIESRYRAFGIAPWFRLPECAAVEPIAVALVARGYAVGAPTWVLVVDAERLRHVARGAASPIPVTLGRRPDAGWEGVFFGEGFDPAEGRARVAALSRAADAVYVSARDDTSVVAIGTGAFAEGWVGVHGMRTLPAARGRGYATRVIDAIAEAALARGLTRMFLQVEADNAPALALYERLGFRRAWCYRYWMVPAPS